MRGDCCSPDKLCAERLRTQHSPTRARRRCAARSRSVGYKEADTESTRHPVEIAGIKSPTMSITRISGGEAVFGMAAGVAEPWLDRRVAPNEHLDDVLPGTAGVLPRVPSDIRLLPGRRHSKLVEPFRPSQEQNEWAQGCGRSARRPRRSTGLDTAAVVDLASTTPLSRESSDLQGASDNSRLAPVPEAARIGEMTHR